MLKRIFPSKSVKNKIKFCEKVSGLTIFSMCTRKDIDPFPQLRPFPMVVDNCV